MNLVYFSSGPTQNPSNRSPDLKAVQACDEKIAIALIKGDVPALIKLYATDCTYLPEFGATLTGSDQLKDFYLAWLKYSRVTTYRKSIYEVQRIDNYLLETGNFTVTYKIATSAIREYTGKYMVIWRQDNSGQLKIFAEAFGADHYVEPADIPYAPGDVTANQPKVDFAASSNIKSLLKEYDRKVVHDVLTGDGAERAGGFTEDGIYMPHFDPMQIGMNTIRSYMLKTYHPNTISLVKDSLRELFDNGNFILLSGHFHVVLNNPQKTSFDGNMLNLMKRNSDGKLLMYRQLAHN